MDCLHQKAAKLKEILSGLGSVAVAFSSGVDSTFLLKVAHDLLGDRAVAVTARSCLFPEREESEAQAFCRAEGIRQVMIELRPFSVEGFSRNPPDRCYLCKRALFTQIREVAAEQRLACVAEGSNLDDTGDYRPGLRAVAELSVRSPLREAGLTKAEIRALSKELGLPTWEKPSFACLASRFVYGEEITEQKLDAVDKAEQRLLDLGFRQVRVRVHGRLARIELLPEELGKLFRPETARDVESFLRELGFLYVTLDLGGYRTGSMNQTIPAAEKGAQASQETETGELLPSE